MAGYAVSLFNSLGWVGVLTWPEFGIDVWHGGPIAESAAVAPNLDDQTKALRAEIAGDARRALDELRGVLGLLRRTELEGSGATVPLPGWAEIPELIERIWAAGLEISDDDRRDSGATVTKPRGVAMCSIGCCRRRSPTRVATATVGRCQ